MQVAWAGQQRPEFSVHEITHGAFVFDQLQTAITELGIAIAHERVLGFPVMVVRVEYAAETFLFELCHIDLPSPYPQAWP